MTRSSKWLNGQDGQSVLVGRGSRLGRVSLFIQKSARQPLLCHVNQQAKVQYFIISGVKLRPFEVYHNAQIETTVVNQMRQNLRDHQLVTKVTKMVNAP